ncbi:MAG: polyphosphate kinase 2 family protein [Elusimicrobiota bacterium]
MRSSLALGLFALWLPAHGANIAAPRVQSGPIATVPFAAAVPSLQAHAGLSAPLGGVTGLLAPALAAPSLQLSPIAAAAAAPAEAVSFELDARSPESLRLVSAALEGPGFEGRLDQLFDGGDLRKADPDATPGFPKHSKKEGQKLLKKEQEKLRELQDKLYAGKKHSVLIVLQAMDTAGKDGTIKHVLTGLNPQGVQVTSFKKPTPEEAAHDFLWRIHPNVPAKGMIGVFNRSHYEDILVPSVYKLMPKDKIDARYDEIKNFEKYLADQGVTIVKIYLNISKDEQKERLEARLSDPRKHWKFDPNDLEARKHWKSFMKTYGKILARTSTPKAPWYVIPANKKWYRNYVIARILRETLEGLDLKYPDPPKGLKKYKVD